MTKIESTAVIEKGVVIGKNCYVGHFTLIRKGAVIGDNTQIRSHCFIGEDVKIGNFVLIRPFSDMCKSTIVEDKVFCQNCSKQVHPKNKGGDQNKRDIRQFAHVRNADTLAESKCKEKGHFRQADKGIF